MPLKPDIIIKEGDARFHYRVAGIIVDQGRVLLQQIKGMDFWFLPGGHGTLLEPATVALRREIHEELNTDVEVGRLVWVVENFFKMGGYSHHEIGLYFLVNLPTVSNLSAANEFTGTDGDSNEWITSNRWHHLREITQMNLVPSFLKTKLQILDFVQLIKI